MKTTCAILLYIVLGSHAIFASDYAEKCQLQYKECEVEAETSGEKSRCQEQADRCQEAFEEEEVIPPLPPEED